MATLQSFQAEIEDIRNRELVKTRTQSQPDALRRHVDHKSVPKVRKKTVSGEAPATSPVTPKPVIGEFTQDLTDIEHSIEARHTRILLYHTIPTDILSYRVRYYLQREEVLWPEIY